MNKKNYTTLPVSQAISAVVEVKTEKCWDSHAIPESKIDGYGITDDGEYPAYSLSEALLAIKELGNILNWNELENWLNPLKYNQHELLTAWQQDGGRMDGEAVSKYLIALFKE